MPENIGSWRVEYIADGIPTTRFVMESPTSKSLALTANPATGLISYAVVGKVKFTEAEFTELVTTFKQWITNIVIRRYGLPLGEDMNNLIHLHNQGVISTLQIGADNRTVTFNFDYSVRTIEVDVQAINPSTPKTTLRTVRELEKWKGRNYNTFQDENLT